MCLSTPGVGPTRTSGSLPVRSLPPGGEVERRWREEISYSRSCWNSRPLVRCPYNLQSSNVFHRPFRSTGHKPLRLPSNLRLKPSSG